MEKQNPPPPPSPRPSDEPELPPMPAAGLTDQESATVGHVLLAATAKRIKILTQSLINSTSSADYWIWAPLAGMEATFQEMPWDEVDKSRPLASERLLALSAVLLRQLSRRYAEYLHQLEGARAADEKAPAPFDWTSDDTNEVYDLVAAMFPDPQPRDNARVILSLKHTAALHGVTEPDRAAFVEKLNDAACGQVERWAMNVVLRQEPAGEMLPVMPRPACVPGPTPETPRE